MEPEDDKTRTIRLRKLAELGESLGLVVEGDTVIAPIASQPIAVDASALNLDQLVAGLMYLAYKQGVEHGQRDVGTKLHALLEDSGALKDVMPEEVI